MATASNKVPPQHSNFKSYNDWVCLINIWTKFTDLEPERQGPALVMSLSGKALEAILELDDKDISSKDGVKLVEKLNILYKKDELHEKFQNFESYRRASDTNIQQFLIEFDQRYHKLKQHQTTISEDLLGFKLLKAANLSSHHEQLIKATITHIDYETIKAKIKSIFSNKVQTLKIKAEPTFLTKESISEEDEEYENNNGESIDEPADTLYLQTKKRISPQQYKHQSTRSRPPDQRQNYNHLPTSSNWNENLNPRTSQRKNPLKNGQPTRCKIC